MCQYFHVLYKKAYQAWFRGAPSEKKEFRSRLQEDMECVSTFGKYTTQHGARALLKLHYAKLNADGNASDGNVPVRPVGKQLYRRTK